MRKPVIALVLALMGAFLVVQQAPAENICSDCKADDYANYRPCWDGRDEDHKCERCGTCCATEDRCCCWHNLEDCDCPMPAVQ